MVGGGSRRDEGPVWISSSNVFAALDSLRKKKKTDKSKGKDASKSQPKDPEPQVFWQPTPLQSVSWADVDDDDDYFATAPPPKVLFGTSGKQETEETSVVHEKETESEDGDLDEGEEDVDDEPQDEPEVPDHDQVVIKKQIPAVVIPKEAERQLSKKELKKRELAELEAVLAEFRVSEPEQSQEENSTGLPSVAEKDNGPIPTESKTSKKKKKKEKTSKEVAKDSLEQANCSEILPNGASETQQADDDNPAVDVKERLKKVASLKKKSNKELNAAAKAAAAEVAARNAKLAAALEKGSLLNQGVAMVDPCPFAGGLESHEIWKASCIYIFGLELWFLGTV